MINAGISDGDTVEESKGKIISVLKNNYGNRSNNTLMKTCVFQINLLRDKKIVREVEVLENFNLYKLADAIISAFGFNFDHAFGFFSETAEDHYFNSDRKYELFADMKDKDIEPTGAKSVKKTKINDFYLIMATIGFLLLS